MKRKSKKPWQEKVDSFCLNYLEGYGKYKEVINKLGSDPGARELIDRIASLYPEIQKLETVEVKPEFINLLRSSELTKKSGIDEYFKTGAFTLPYNMARIIRRMQMFTLALEEKDVQIATAIGGTVISLVVGNIFESVRKQNFGDSDLTPEQFMWLTGRTLEILGRSIKTNKKDVAMKGKANAELLELIKTIREHQIEKLNRKELIEALAVAGMHVPNEESLRLYEWRAKKAGRIKYQRPSTE